MPPVKFSVASVVAPLKFNVPFPKLSAVDLLYAPLMVLVVAAVNVSVPLSVVPPTTFSVPLLRVILPATLLVRVPFILAVPVMLKMLLLIMSPVIVPVSPPTTCTVPLLVSE